jgi:hypothetical protein
MRTVIVALGVSSLCVLAPVSSKAKTDHAKCEDRCRAYYCPDNARRELYCHYQCHKMCASEDRDRNRAPSDKDHAENVSRAIACEVRQFDHRRLLNFL